MRNGYKTEQDHYVCLECNVMNFFIPTRRVKRCKRCTSFNLWKLTKPLPIEAVKTHACPKKRCTHRTTRTTRG